LSASWKINLCCKALLATNLQLMLACLDIIQHLASCMSF